MPTAYLLLGSNLGDRRQNLVEALAGISYLGTVTRVSSVYRSEAWGNLDQPDFLNATVELATSHTPQRLLNELLDVEAGLGRVRAEKWGARLIDIDILFYDSQIIRVPGLTIPHPEIQNRKFTLVPLDEIAGSFVHPALNKSIRQLLDACADPLTVEKEISLA